MSTELRLALMVVLIACNAWFVVSKYVLITARRLRLVELADAGDHSAAAAIRLLEQPMRLIGTVQAGISALGVGRSRAGRADVPATV